MKKTSLPTITLSEEMWDRVLDNSLRHEEVDSLADYMCGYRNRNVIYYTTGTDSDMLIAEAYYLFYVIGVPYDFNYGWKQYLCIKSHEQTEPVIFDAVSPISAVKAVSRELKSKYTDEEIEAIYTSHEATKAQAEILHHNILYGAGLSKNIIYKFKDCWYYDLNGAYASELIGMFDRCSEQFRYWFEHRHDNHDKFKNYFNYFVGCLTQNEKKYKDGKPTRNIHPKSRYYIIKKITDMMYYGLKKLGFKRPDDAIYVNTDGLIVQHPKYEIGHSSEMGKFKLEYHGDIYMFRGENGWCMQYGDCIKGMIPTQLRDKVDLRKGKMVSYDIMTKNGCRKPINITEREYEIIEIN